jgi:hypothetical protein
MATFPISHEATASPASSLTERFQQLRSDWWRETAFLSSMTAAAAHPAYQEIIRLGTEIVPLLLQDMEDHQTHWFIALEQITGAQPIPPSAAGNIPKMIEAWLKWGKEHGYR